MRDFGNVASGHDYELPDGWVRVGDDVLEGALARTLSALAAERRPDPETGAGRLEQYFDPASEHAGMSFNALDRAAGAVRAVTPADLLAVTLLRVDVEPRQARQLLGDHPKRTAVTAALAAVPQDVALGDFGSGTRDFAAVLDQLHTLYAELCATPDPSSDRWVFASTLCARKLPHLMPVRDTVVCSYLAGAPLTGSALGSFEVDLQVFAYLMSHPQVRRDLKAIQSRLRHRFGAVVEAVPLLRLLDVTLWMAGIGTGPWQLSRPATV